MIRQYIHHNKRRLQWILGCSSLLFLCSGANLSAQTLSVGTPGLEERYRREQLLGRLDSTISFAVRPLTNSALQQGNLYDPDASSYEDRSILSTFGGEGMLQLMPLVWQNQYTSAYPYGINDGAMIPARGWQTLFSGGIYASYKFISIQLRPEFVSAQNKSYLGFDGKTEPSWQAWYQYLGNQIDMPEQFGNGSYTKVFWGQSAVRLNFDPISVGVSTENLWWGPGRQNSLLMTNTAPGFAHLTLNTTRPIRTGIGSFEGQLIAGHLSNSGYTPVALGTPAHYDQYYEPKRDDWRYLSGIVFSYQPKWLPGLSVGFTQSYVRYHNDNNTLNNYLPLLGSGSDWKDLESPDRPANGEAEKQRDQYGSIFTRWAFPKGKAEVYFEYGRNDKPWNNRDRLVELEHSRAYVMGFTKLVPLKNSQDDLLQFNIELTQLETSRTSEVRTSPSWYTNSIVRQGYTHLGQILGAGIGPGSNMQSISLSWIRKMKQIELQAERLVHNNDLYYEFSRDIRRNWVDFALGLQGVWDYQHFLFTGGIKYIHANNYQYEISNEYLTGSDFWNFDRHDKTNIQAKLGVMYRF